MEASYPPPEGIMLPPSPVGSSDSFDSTSSGPAAEQPREAKCDDNVMITLSLTPDPPVQTPTRLPFARSHIRSRSMVEVPGLPPMTRAHSSPGLDSRGRYIFVNGRGASTNAGDPAAKRYLPLQVTTGDGLESRMVPLNISETISEHAELDTNLVSSPSHIDYHPTSPVFSHTLPRVNRRRPSSPLHFQSPSSSVHSMGSPSGHSSPVIYSMRYNESYPGYSASSTSSIPSTPTSLRSRSPSISSLETIPDIPDAEAAAIEADRIAALKAAADKADEAEAASNGNRRRGASDASGPSSGLMTMRAGSVGYGPRADKRKRWSVCGAERRQDLDLETIWED
ncbi:hypothetical protein CAN33_006710 [Aspergillus niger]|uniref:Basic proline-rich protein n=1 Tax=Aspergillus niger TaxID=5061 RepID=A0A3F3RIS0_ASPNG|nr:hypothetical protein CBS147345_7245 [Aspergillus niger]KAI3026527.1 hypothetical protein CBS147482_777 [Aspergillus niger]TPR08943.1 hypothetical protein CAN33_006710 [Aspergillus niger]SPB47995.1 unnamed protein product [Aspergillus niger]